MTFPSNERLASRILWSLLVGLLLGLGIRGLVAIAPGTGPAVIWLAQHVLDPIGQVFLRLLFFVVVPLVFASLALGIVQLGRLDKLGPLAGKTFLLFFINMTIAVALGLAIMNLVRPGDRVQESTKENLITAYQSTADEFKTRSEESAPFSAMTLVEMFMPRNLLKAVVEFNILPLILFAILVGAAATGLPGAQQESVKSVLEIVTQLMTRIVRFALLLAPIAVPAMISSAVIRFGLDLLQALFLFVAAALAGMAIHLLVTLPAMLKLLSRRSPLAVFRAIRIVLVTGFSTSSSSATLPTSLQVSRDTLGISASTSGFVLPLGATMNMSGTALYEGCVVLFVAQVYGLDLALNQQLLLLLLAVLSSVAVAGIPGGSLPLIVGLLVNFQIPAEGIALILGIDRLLDMSRTVLNVGADMVTACIVDDWNSNPLPRAASSPSGPA